jgi:hypothetical protein
MVSRFAYFLPQINQQPLHLFPYRLFHRRLVMHARQRSQHNAQGHVSGGLTKFFFKHQILDPLQNMFAAVVKFNQQSFVPVNDMSSVQQKKKKKKNKNKNKNKKDMLLY